MNRKTLILILITTGIFLSACQKNSDIFVPDSGQLNGPDTAWYSTVTASMPVNEVKNSLLYETYTDSIQVNSNTAYITTPFGMICGFPPNSCVGNAGQVITGTVNVQLTLVKKKGDMIRLNKPTTSNGRLLVSGGEIFIGLKKGNGDTVHLAPNARIFIRYADAPLDQNMKFFVGDQSNPERFNWLPKTDTINTITLGPPNYEIATNQLGWINCDRFYDTANIPQVTVTANLASYFTNANTVAYTVFKDLRAVTGMYGDVSTRKFSTGKLPGGKVITVVVISKQGNDYFLGYETATTITATSANTTQSVLVKPVKKSLSDIIGFLNSL